MISSPKTILDFRNQPSRAKGMHAGKRDAAKNSLSTISLREEGGGSKVFFFSWYRKDRQNFFDYIFFFHFDDETWVNTFFLLPSSDCLKRSSKNIVIVKWETIPENFFACYTISWNICSLNPNKNLFSICLCSPQIQSSISKKYLKNKIASSIIPHFFSTLYAHAILHFSCDFKLQSLPFFFSCKSKNVSGLFFFS